MSTHKLERMEKISAIHGLWPLTASRALVIRLLMYHFIPRVDWSAARHCSNQGRKVSESLYRTGISTKYRLSQERLQDYAFCLEVPRWTLHVLPAQ